ncbi:MAG: hypothetical protein A2513_10715 [Sulfurimonas sp. RIFOXYD12_FULL_33_39]|uniref:hypothetical protein n=1 Tax=unclassified Sulfurimonas TaxID=2623549 RepID=UPI0008B9FBEB|nr:MULTISPECIES: hypothetical protein [unclassified Sulfurimonas]OHE07131.1 MAG: hypothetical protein A3G74_02555 [Sulfurimonas sp. RIFCSPLOWO2_12_FULL_34_6]OHE09778.1 MAG: hypothetical protein A2513_10715 [Sulfurimonas sp. RIFOXYD12_FULL_33_39]OHE13714.1 MAG: hypothetical protein A2530_09040 [Sulfurimonas sp. RIFOXYD2_FULL_34_21]DAB28071.1 MAG TPA: hypothetical protein CFH78_04210 [Sulfurimonas sp. UBA10385]
MEVTRYLFQSPYSSQIQIGRPDTSSVGSDKNSQDDSALLKSTNKSLSSAETFKATQTQEVKPTVASTSLLDVIA